jgi:alanyl-tRNA synthetase
MSDLEEKYRLDYFEEHEMVRRECASCGDHFWTRDHDRRVCGEPPCGEYTFIDDPGFDREFSLEEMREHVLSFFAARGHGRLEPYPVAATRWRDDVLLTQASVYDFQPHVTSGQTPPPANPLTISQPCIRMQDIDNVGVTGRHTMAFEMMAHHAFNTVEDVSEDRYAYHGEVYWKDRTVAYCDELLESVGVDLEEVVYIEDPWTGGGNAGPALEVIYRGAEVATLVFMSMEEDPDGEYELKGERYTPMDRYVVDTGYGLERWTWVSQGTPTVYEAVYPEMIDFLRDNAGLSYDDEADAVVAQAARLAGKMDIDEAEDVEAARADIAREVGVSVERLRELVEPLESIYAIADHCRTLAYMLGDGIVPSNVGSGYLARMVLRRTKRLADDVDVDAPLDELVDMQAERLGYENRDTVRDVVRTEIESYRETLERGESKVQALADEYAAHEEPIPVDELVELYDSHGIHPDTVEEMVAERGVSVEQADDFFALVASRHGGSQALEAVEEVASHVAGAGIEDRLADLPATERLYYEDQSGTEFEAVVLDVFEREDGEGDESAGAYDVVLDGTMFYPEGGGQPADRGVLSGDDETADVADVQVHDDVVVHRVNEELDTGEIVRGHVDAERRRQLMRNHTATHVVIHAAREVLGDHVRQAGAQKGTESSRIDLQHYRRVSREEVKQIERVANEVVTDDGSVSQEFVGRHEAETEHGFDLYQGGVPTGEQLRLVHVAEDVQACGGTHVARTGEIGAIKILRTEPVQDGVERFVFAAGPAAVEATQRTEDALYEAADTLDVSPREVPEAAARFFEEWKERGKRIDELTDEIATLRASGDDGETVDVGEATAVVRRIDADMDQLRATANAIVAEGQIAVLGAVADGAQFVVAVPDGVGVNAGEVVGRLAEIVGGGGGGPPDFAQGGGPDVDRLDEALTEAPDVLRTALNA